MRRFSPLLVLILSGVPYVVNGQTNTGSNAPPRDTLTTHVRDWSYNSALSGSMNAMDALTNRAHRMRIHKDSDSRSGSIGWYSSSSRESSGRSRLDEQIRSEMLMAGYVPVEPPHRGRLGNQSRETFRLVTEASRALRLQGLCDRNCRDLDLELLDGRGRVIAADDNPGNTPVLELPRGHRTSLRVRAVMNQCTSVECGYQVITYWRK